MNLNLYFSYSVELMLILFKNRKYFIKHFNHLNVLAQAVSLIAVLIREEKTIANLENSMRLVDFYLEN
jgi:hypothetical protein